MTGVFEHDDRSVAEYLEDLRDAGADFSQPVPVEQYLYFPFATLAQGVAEELRREGFSVDIDPDAEREGWIAYVTRRVVPTVGEIVRMRNRVGTLAVARG